MPKLDEEDFVDPGNLPAIAQSKSPVPGATATPAAAMPATGGFGSPAAVSGFGSSGFGGGMNSSMPAASTPSIDRNAGGANAAQGADVLVANDNTDWINKKWRPVMGWVYMLTCTMDFVVFPILWSVLQAIGNHGQVASQWNPITLQGAGLYHIAMGAVLGIAAYGRTKEKVAGAA